MTEPSRAQELMGDVSKATRSHLRFGSEVEAERIETPSIGLTAALSGGWIMGRQVLIWGPKSAGKSTLLLQQIAIAQRQGKLCALMDAENAFDKVWARKNGVNLDELVYSNASTVTDIVNDGRDMMESGVDLIGLDSVSVLMPASYLDKDGELKPFENTGALGGLSRSIGPALSQLTHINHRTPQDTLLLMVSQARMEQKGQTHWGLGPMGGKALEHAASQTIKLFASESKDNMVQGQVTAGDRVFEKNIGREIVWTVAKDRGGPGMGATGSYMLYFDGDFIGVDNYDEILRIGVEHGVVRRGGAWYYYGDTKLGQGALNAAAKLRSDDKLFQEIKDQL